MFDGMTMYHHTMNLPKLLVWGIQHRVYPKSLRATPTSDMQACGTGDLSKSRSFEPNPFPSRGGLNRPALGLANTIGVIGGKSSASTIHFLEKLVVWSMGDGEESLPFIVCNDPVLNRELAAYERSSLPYHNSRNTCSQFDHTPIVKNLQHKRLFLEMSGAHCIVMPCHASHMWHKEIWEGSSVPLLHVGECVAQELKAANLKPVETGSNLRIGVLATDSVLSAGFYQKKLENQGFEVVVPDKATMEHTVIPALEAVKKRDMEGARNLLRIALQVLLVRAVNTVILASDDLHGLLPRDDPLLKKCTDPMDALARATIRWAKLNGK